jgi:hypothetical protein
MFSFEPIPLPTATIFSELSRYSQRFEEKNPRIIFDLDGTLTRERSIWEYIHKQLGKWVGFAEAYQRRFLAGLISYEEFCELDAKVWKGNEGGGTDRDRENGPFSLRR